MNFGHHLGAGLQHTWLLQELGASREHPQLLHPALGAATARWALSAAAARCGFVVSPKPSLGRGSELPSLSFLPLQKRHVLSQG